MKKIALFFLLGTCLAMSAQVDSSTASGNEESARKKSFLRGKGLNFAFPEINIYYCMPSSNPDLARLPMGAGQFLNPARPSYGNIFPFEQNYRFRIFGIYYKDKFDLEFLYGGFGGQVSMNAFVNYFDHKFPGHTYTRYSDGGVAIWNECNFQGPQIGLGYKIHLKYFIVEPKFQLGFEKLSDFTRLIVLKENFSNQFIEYTISQNVRNKDQRSFHFQLNVEKRFSLSKKYSFNKLIVGLKAEYIYAPYTAELIVSEKPYNKPAEVYTSTIKTSFRMFNFGIYFGFMIKK